MGTNSSTFVVIVQLATGHFAPAVTLGNGTQSCPFGPSWKVAGTVDVDRDGRNDLIRSVQCGDGTQAMLVNTSTPGGFADAQLISLPLAFMVYQAAAGDIDGDGDKDLVGIPFIVGGLPTSLNVLKLNGTGGFDASSVPLSSVYSPGTVTVKDLNANRRADIIVTSNDVLRQLNSVTLLTPR